MTKVDVCYALEKALDESKLSEIALAHSVYGLFRVRLSPAMDSVSVEYDASRLTGQQVEAVLRGMGLPIR